MAKFLTYEERLELEAGLRNHLSFTEIGLKLNRDRTTIAKEVRLYSIEQCTGYSFFRTTHANTGKNASVRKCVGEMTVGILWSRSASNVKTSVIDIAKHLKRKYALVGLKPPMYVMDVQR